jgi:hypothetical protein
MPPLRGEWNALLAAVLLSVATRLSAAEPRPIASAAEPPPIASAAQPPLIPVGPDAYTMWDRWAYQRIGERAYMRSTYDRSGGNEWSDSSHFLYQLADDRNVTLDVAGSGVLYFVRTNRWHGSPWHYVIDGVDHLIGESDTADPTHPVSDPHFVPEPLFPMPVALTWRQTRGADLSWVPIGFRRSLRLAYSRTFYGTGYYIYHLFAPGTQLSRPLQSWQARSAPDPAISALISRSGSDIAPPTGAGGAREASGVLALEGNGTAVLPWNARGSWVIRALKFSVPLAQAALLSSARLRITWDGRAEPSVDAPIGLFFGAGVLYNRDRREFLVRSFPMVVRYSAERVYLSCYFPMPFFRSARIEIDGDGHSSVEDIRWTIRFVAYTGPSHDVGYFHATYRDHPGPPRDPAPGEDLTLLDTSHTEGGGDWSGSFVGTSLIFSHRAQLDTLEGDPRFFFDDSQTPQAQGTGTEEWAGGGDYWNGENTTLAFAGHPVGARSAADSTGPEDRIESAYRFLLADLMPFGKRALIRLEHGGCDESSEHYETLAYWYGLPAASLLESDELAIGDPRSERAHEYLSPQASAPYTLTSRYEWGPDTLGGKEVYPASADRGRYTTTFSDFTVAVAHDNFGVLLRRKLDYGFPNQRAEVYVRDVSPGSRWRFAGIWYTAGSNTDVASRGGGRELGTAEHIVQVSNRRFRDDEFLISRELTRGRDSIRIRIRFTPVAVPLFPGRALPVLAWSEMRYTVYCYVLPRFGERRRSAVASEREPFEDGLGNQPDGQHHRTPEERQVNH